MRDSRTFQEEREGKLLGFEFKWSDRAKPKDWMGTYANAELAVIGRENYLDFIL